MAKTPDLLISFDTPERPLRAAISMPLIPCPMVNCTVNPLNPFDDAVTNIEENVVDDPFELVLKNSLQLGKKREEKNQQEKKKNESSRRKKSGMTRSRGETNFDGDNNINDSITDKENSTFGIDSEKCRKLNSTFDISQNETTTLKEKVMRQIQRCNSENCLNSTFVSKGAKDVLNRSCSEVGLGSREDSIILGGSEFSGFTSENQNRTKTKLDGTFRSLSVNNLSQCLNTTKSLNETFNEFKQEALKLYQIFNRFKPQEFPEKKWDEDKFKFSLDRTFISDVKPPWVDSSSSEDEEGLPKVKLNRSLTLSNLPKKEAVSNFKKFRDSLNCSEGNLTFTKEKEENVQKAESNERLDAETPNKVNEESTNFKEQIIGVAAPKDLQNLKPKKPNVTDGLITKKGPLKALVPLKKMTRLGARKTIGNSIFDKTGIIHKGIKADSNNESINMIQPVAASTPDKTRVKARNLPVLNQRGRSTEKDTLKRPYEKKMLFHNKDSTPKQKLSPPSNKRLQNQSVIRPPSASNSREVLSQLVTSHQTQTKPGNKILPKNSKVKKMLHVAVQDKENHC